MLNWPAVKNSALLFKSNYISWLNKYPILGGALSFGVVAVVLLGGHRLIIQSKVDWQLERYEVERARLKAERDHAYKELLERQAQESQNRESLVTTAAGSEKLIGQKRVHLIFVKEPTLSSEVPQALMSQLLTQGLDNKSSLYYLSQFIQNQAQEYEQASFTIEIVPHAVVYDLPQLERVGDVANPWGKDPFATSRLKDQFDSVIDKESLAVKDGEAVLFFYFDPSSGTARDTSASFYDHKAFRSFADETSQRAYINVYTAAPSFAPVLTEIATHEFLHLYGATDKYLETEYGCTDEGHGDTEKNPRIPQETTDIMCGLIEHKNDQFIRGGFADDTLVINTVTAQEIGWE